MKNVIMACLMAVWLSGQAQSTYIDMAQGLVGYYSLDGQAQGLVPGTPDGVPMGLTYAENRFAAATSAAAFDGVNQHMRIPFYRDAHMEGVGGYTIALWIQPRDENTGCLILKEGDWGLKWNGMRKPLGVFNGMQDGFPEGRFAQWSSAVWYHLALVYEGGKLTLYINGEVDRTWTTKPRLSPPERDIFVGKHPYFWGGFTGKVDDLLVYRRALNPYEVQVLTQVEHIPVEDIQAPAAAGVSLEALQGTWQGVISQPGHDRLENLAFWVELGKAERGVLRGHTRIEMAEGQAYAVSDLRAFVSGARLNLEERQIIRQKNHQGYRWCQKYGQLTYDPERQTLRGTWYADNCALGGKILLYRTDAPFNYYDNRLSVKVKVEELAQKLAEDRTGKQLQAQLMQLDLPPLPFNLNETALTSEGEEILRGPLLKLLLQYPQLQVNISGYTDTKGNDAYNLELSVARAKSVYEYLMLQGVHPGRMTHQGFGEANPIASNDTAEGRSRNRRVEIEVYIP